MSTDHSASHTLNGVAVPQTSAVVQKALAIMVGIFVIGVVGFSHIDAIHNAAHDTRHANAFPCH